MQPKILSLNFLNYLLATILIVCFSSCGESDSKSVKATSDTNYTDGFHKIFNGENFDGWYLKLRNNDPDIANEVFAIDDGMVHVFKNMKDSTDLNTGENGTHGLFYTKKKYSKYILRFEYKWGEKITNNFNEWQYDAGLYYHVSDDNVWPIGIEYQIRYDHRTDKNHSGDLIKPAGANYDWYANENTSTYLHPDEGGKLNTSKRAWNHLASGAPFNGTNGEWNKCEVIVMGGEYTIHKLNGVVVNMAFNLTPNEGIFGFQSETAEIFYRNIEIREFDKIIPAEEFLN